MRDYLNARGSLPRMRDRPLFTDVVEVPSCVYPGHAGDRPHAVCLRGWGMIRLPRMAWIDSHRQEGASEEWGLFRMRGDRPI